MRARMEAAAERLIVRQGAASFTMRELAAEVGCSPMLAYRYFADKNELVAAVRANAFAKFATALETSDGDAGAEPAARSHRVGEAYVRFAFAHPQLYRLMFDTAPVEEGRYPRLDAAGDRARRTMTHHVEGLVSLGLLVGDPTEIGYVFWASLHGLVMLALSGQLADSPGFERLSVAMSEALIRGLRPQSNP